MEGKKFNAISIYSGAGGIDIGFIQAGFRILYVTDNWNPACETLKKNKSALTVECNDIRKINFKEIKKNLGKEIDVVIGGPPCPSFSKSRFYLKSKKRALEDSEGSYVIKEYFRCVEEINPKVFFFENVHGFVFKPHIKAFNFLKKRSDELGYQLTWKIVNTANYGVPQIRERFVCIGVKNNLPKFIFPKETHYNPEDHNQRLNATMKPWVTCGEAIGEFDYEIPEDSKMQAGSKHKELLRQIPPGDNYLFFTKERGHPEPKFKWRSRYWSFLLKLSPDKPSWTIQASHSNNMGPFHWRNRFLRINEIKRIQTFPDNYELFGDYKTQWRLIGNAVPPLMAKIIAEAIKKQILNS